MRRPEHPTRTTALRAVGPLTARAVVAGLLLAGCSSGGSTTAAPTTAPTTESTAAPTTAVSTTAVPTSAVPTSGVPTSAPPTNDASLCTRIDDFGDGASERWGIVNDGVMGGRSNGTAAFDGDTMVFAGTIVTDGGGFSSVRHRLPAPLGDATELRLRVRTDGRSYEIQVEDTLEGRDRRVSHFGAIPAADGSEWNEVVVPFAGLDARAFGTPVDDAPFRPDLASEIGIFLADGSDGDFQFEIDWIDACTVAPS